MEKKKNDRLQGNKKIKEKKNEEKGKRMRERQRVNEGEIWMNKMENMQNREKKMEETRKTITNEN